MADAPNTDQRFFTERIERLSCSDSPDNAEDLYLFYTTPDRFGPIAQFEYDKEQRSRACQQGAEAYKRHSLKALRLIFLLRHRSLFSH